jgi:hypothetical protein
MSRGYSIDLYDDDAVVESYRAGGHPRDSQEEGESPLSTVRQWAISTAKEMFTEYAGRLPETTEIEVEIKSPDEE